jgi:GTP cyclohydrolase IA
MKTTNNQYTYSWVTVTTQVAQTFQPLYDEVLTSKDSVAVYGVPRGGVNIAQIISAEFEHAHIAASPDECDIIVDDIIDSGATRDKFAKSHANLPFYAPVIKSEGSVFKGKWIVFPWEANDEEEGAEDNVRRLLQVIGENPNREGLIETPKRFIKALKEMTAGYHTDPVSHLSKSFDVRDSDPDVGTYDELIMSGPLPFTSMCEHHMALFEGHAWIGYIPNANKGRVVGLSKLARLLDGYAHRLQVQERLTMQVANGIQKALDPSGVAVVIRARHTCQCVRGVKKDGRMVTSSLKGFFKDDPSSRSEFFQLLRMTD